MANVNYSMPLSSSFSSGCFTMLDYETFLKGSIISVNFNELTKSTTLTLKNFFITCTAKNGTYRPFQYSYEATEHGSTIQFLKKAYSAYKDWYREKFGYEKTTKIGYKEFCKDYVNVSISSGLAFSGCFIINVSCNGSIPKAEFSVSASEYVVFSEEGHKKVEELKRRLFKKMINTRPDLFVNDLED